MLRILPIRSGLSVAVPVNELMLTPPMDVPGIANGLPAIVEIVLFVQVQFGQGDIYLTQVTPTSCGLQTARSRPP